MLTEEPVDPWALIGLGWAYYGKCNCNDSPYHLIHEAIERAPEVGEPCSEMGLLHDRDRNYIKALLRHFLALDRDPSN